MGSVGKLLIIFLKFEMVSSLSGILDNSSLGCKPNIATIRHRSLIQVWPTSPIFLKDALSSTHIEFAASMSTASR